MNDPVVLLVGDDFLVEEALSRLRAQLGTDPLSEVEFDAGAPAADVVAALETPSLLGGRRLVIVHGAHSLTKDQTALLERYLESPSPHSVLVLIGSGRTRLADAASRAGSVVTLQPPKGRQLIGWIRERGRGHGVELDERAAWALRDAAGAELRDLDAALAQMASAFPSGERIGAVEVRSQFPRLAEERVYAFTDAVGDRRLDIAMTALRRLLDQGDEPLVIFGALAAQVRRMLVARSVAEGGARAVGERLGMPEWRAKRLERQARPYREDELAAAVEKLAAADVEMKGGDLPPEVALERAVIEIVATRAR